MGPLSKNDADTWFADHSTNNIKIFPNKDVVQHLRYALEQVTTKNLFLGFEYSQKINIENCIDICKYFLLYKLCYK